MIDESDVDGRVRYLFFYYGGTVSHSLPLCPPSSLFPWCLFVTPVNPDLRLLLPTTSIIGPVKPLLQLVNGEQSMLGGEKGNPRSF